MKFIEYDQFSDVEDVWKELYSKQNIKKPFQHPDIVKAADTFAYKLKFIGNGFISRVKYYICYVGATPIMVVALRYIQKNVASVLGSLEDYDKVEILYDESYEFDVVFCKLLLFLKKMGCAELIWNQLPEYSEQFCALKNLNFDISVEDNTSVCIEFDDDYNTYFQGLKKNSRQNIRTAYNRLKRENNVLEFEILMSKDIVDAKKLNNKYKDYMKIYTARRVNRYQTNGIVHKIFSERFHFFAKSYQSENGFLAGILINGSTAACMQGFVSESMTIMEVPRLAINEKFAFFSPGLILVNEMIKYLINKTTVRSLDLCGGDEKYKFDCGGTAYLTANVRIKFM